MSKHTEGPWDYDAGDGTVYKLDDPEVEIALTLDRYPGLTVETILANARLIAAAPELLAACHSGLQYLLTVDHATHTGGNCPFCTAFGSLLDAIGKAEED